MNRRGVLGLCGAGVAGLVGLTGCTSHGDRSTDGQSSATGSTSGPGTTGIGRATETERDRTETVGSRREPQTTGNAESGVEVSFGGLQPAVAKLVDDTGDVEASAGQYLFVEVSGDGDEFPEVDEFRFQFAGREYRAVDGYGWSRYVYDGVAYRPENGSGWILFELPDGGDAADAKLIWEGGQWVPGEATRNRLATPYPDLELSASLPESIPEGQAPTVSAKVTNAGEYGTEFVAVLERIGGVPQRAVLDVVNRRIPPGGSDSYQYVDEDISEIDPEGVGDEDPVATYELKWEGRDRVSELRANNR